MTGAIWKKAWRAIRRSSTLAQSRRWATRAERASEQTKPSAGLWHLGPLRSRASPELKKVLFECVSKATLVDKLCLQDEEMLSFCKSLITVTRFSELASIQSHAELAPNLASRFAGSRPHNRRRGAAESRQYGRRQRGRRRAKLRAAQKICALGRREAS